MAFRDLRDFIDRLEELGETRRISGAACNLEIGAITEVAAESASCPLVIFDSIDGCRPGNRVVTNLLHTEKRLAVALGEPHHLRGIPLVARWKDSLGNLKNGPPPVTVRSGPVMENMIQAKDVNLYDLPAVTWHQHDGGPYFTGGVVIMNDPDDHWVNLGVYRLQVQNSSTLSLAIEPGKHGRLIAQKYWSTGKACPVAISLGHAPALFIAATLMAPWGLSEYVVAGQINGGPIEVLPGPATGLPVPATSEVVLEGEAPPPEVESRPEGPFGEATGYYASQVASKPVVRVTSIMHRHQPIVHGAPPMKPLPGLWHFPVNYRCASFWSDLEKCGIPDIRGVWQHSYGLTVISLKQKYAGHAKQAALIARGSRSSENVRFIVTVDEDIDPCNLTQVMWAISTRCDPEKDIETIRDGWSGAIDPMVTPAQRATNDLTTPKVMINACKPIFRRGEFPRVVEASQDLKSEVLKKWGNAIT